jgi:N-acetylneuraminate synthase
MPSTFDWKNWHKNALQNNKKIISIAEIGINHNGDLGQAKSLMDLSKSVGCTAVKFQKRTIDTVYKEDFLLSARESVWGKTQRDQKEGLEFSFEEYKEIDKYSKHLQIDWTASAWDEKSLDFVESFNPPFHKVASVFITHPSFLKQVASIGRLTFVSTGMCQWEDVDLAVEIFKNANCPFVLMHCVSTYPTEKSNLNLMAISKMKSRYPDVPIGYSGHESNVSPTIAAVALGAVAIERHVTLNRALPGSDQAASLEPAGLRNLIGAIDQIPDMIGDGEKRYMPGEIETAKKLRYWL